MYSKGGMNLSKITDEIKKAINMGVVVPDELNNRDVVRGVYGIFSENESECNCIYIRRSYSIADRLFNGRGYICMFNNGNYDKLVPKMIHEDLSRGNHIIIKVLAVVDFIGDNYYRDMQRLSFAEIRLIEEYQEKGQCLRQLPEGTWISKEKWKARYEKKSNKV